jgi:hypothetical protein
LKAGTLDGWNLWKNPHSLGRAFIYKGDVSSGNRKEVFRAFASGETSPYQKLYLEKQPISSQPRHELSPLENKENHYVIPENKSGYLVVTQTAIPGWRVWVDKNPRNLFLADGIFQCVPLSQDDRTVDLRYEPASFRLGLFISFLTLAGLAVRVFFNSLTFPLKRS